MLRVKNLLTRLFNEVQSHGRELDCAKNLVKKVHDPAFEANARDEQGDTPLHQLVKLSFKEKKLKLKAELIVCVLTYSAADIDIPDNSGNTPLHTAVKADEMEVVRVLVAFNANINAVNNERKTPLDLAPPSSDQATASPAESNMAAFLVSCGAEHGDNLKPPRFDFSKVGFSCRGDYFDQCAEAISTIDTKFKEKTKEVLSAEQETPGSAKELARLAAGFERMKKAGARVLCLDGGGIRGLIQMEVLSQLERATGKKVTELFDWIFGTSTGGVVALSVVYPKKTLHEMRQFLFKTRFEVFGDSFHGIKFNTDALIDIYQTNMGSYCMSDVKIPKVLIPAVDKSSANLKVRYFNNCFDDDYSTQEIWKVARYTSAAPTMFKEMDDFVDGGVLVQNPSMAGMARVKEHYQSRGYKGIPVPLVVSIGTGIPPDRKLGSVDAQDLLSFGTHWFNGEVKEKLGNLGTLLSNAISYSDGAHLGTMIMCNGFNIPYFRFDPNLPKAVAGGETDLDTLLSMMIITKTTCRKQVGELVEKLYQNMEARADTDILKI